MPPTAAIEIAGLFGSDYNVLERLQVSRIPPKVDRAGLI